MIYLRMLLQENGATAKVQKGKIFYLMFVDNSQVSSRRTRRKRRRSERRKRSKKRMKRRLMSPISINKYHWTTFLDDR